MNIINTDKTIYEPKESSDGTRILVMRIWPRGVSKGHIDEWFKDLGSSRPLIEDWKSSRISWSEFRRRYIEEMKESEKQKLIQSIAERAEKETVTLLCSCKDPNRCHRTILRELIEQQY